MARMAQMKFIRMLKQQRRKRKWSQREMAGFISVPLSTYRNWEQGRCLPVNALQNHILWFLAKEL